MDLTCYEVLDPPAHLRPRAVHATSSAAEDGVKVSKLGEELAALEKAVGFDDLPPPARAPMADDFLRERMLKQAAT